MADGHAILEFLPASGLSGSVPLNLEQLGTLILRLGQARADMVTNSARHRSKASR